MKAYGRKTGGAVTHSLCLALGWFLCLRYRWTGDGAAVEVGAFVLFVHSDQPVDVSVGRRGTFQGSVLLLKHRLRFGVLATFPGQEVVPDLPIFQGTHPVSTQLCGWVLSVSSGQERPDSSTSSACAVRRGVFALARFGACCFGTNAGHQPGFIGPRLWAGFGGWADPVGAILQIDGELLEPLCHCNTDGNQWTSLPVPTPFSAIHRGPRDAPLESLSNKRLPLLYSRIEPVRTAGSPHLSSKHVINALKSQSLCNYTSSFKQCK